MSLIRLALRRKRETTTPTGPSTELALPSAALNLIYPASLAGGQQAWHQASQFYDSCGVELRIGQQISNEAWFPLLISAVAECGFRHIRLGVEPSFLSSGFRYNRQLWYRLRNRNNALPASSNSDAGHPIFVNIGIGTWTSFAQQNYGIPWDSNDWFDILDGGRQHYANINASNHPAMGGVPAAGNGGSPIPDGAISGPQPQIPSPWSFAEAEVGWDLVASIEGPNEIAMRPPADGLNSTRITQAQADQLNVDLRTTYQIKANSSVTRNTTRPDGGEIFGGLPYVTASGIQTGTRTSKQIPVFGPSFIDQVIGDHLGDWTVGGVVDAGNVHYYRGGLSPERGSWDQVVSTRSNGIAAIYVLATQPTNGENRVPKDRSKRLPTVVTEGGYLSRAQDFPQRPVPGHVIAEYHRRQLLQLFLMGYRRYFIFEFADPNDDPASLSRNWGMVGWPPAFTRKPQFYGVKNLLRDVGFREAPAGARRELATTVSGFVSDGAQWATSAEPGTYGAHGSQDSPAMPHTDRLNKLQLQTKANEWLDIFFREGSLWDRNVGNATTPGEYPTPGFGSVSKGLMGLSTSNITITLPAEVTKVEVCDLGLGDSAASEALGRTFYNIPITSNKAEFALGGFTKVIRYTV